MSPRVDRLAPPFRLEATRDGLHVEETLLWLDARLGKELAFLSRVPPQPKKITSKILASEETIHLLRLFQHEVDSLSCQYQRPFSIGALSLELFPTGAAFGGAALLLRQKNSSLLYMPEMGFLSPERILEFPPVTQVIMGAFCPDPKTVQAHFDQEWDRLCVTLASLLQVGKSPFLVSPFLAFPQRILSAPVLQSVPVHMHPILIRMHRIYEKFTASPSLYQVPAPDSAIMISPFLPPRKSLELSQRPLLTLIRDDHRTKWPECHPQNTFHFSFFCQKMYRQLFKQIMPEHIYFVGPYALRYAKAFKKCAPHVQPLFVEKQPSLF